MTDPPRRDLPWPPPGLEALRGTAWPLVAVLAIGDVVLALPFLATLGTRRHFASLGPFGEHWWVLLPATAVGIAILTAAMGRLARLAWRAGRAARSGHGWRVILLVAGDGSPDPGALLQGAREFAGLAPRRRRLILTIRLVGTALAFAAVLLAPLGLVLGAPLGSQGWIGTGGLWVLAVWIPVALIVAGGGLLVTGLVLARVGGRRGDRATSRQARAARAEALRGEIVEWNEGAGAAAGADGPRLGAAGRAGAFRATSVALALLAATVVPGLALLAVGGSIGPMLASVAVPRWTASVGRILEAELYRPYVLPRDTTISARAAGEALHTLAGLGAEGPSVRPPARRYGELRLAQRAMPDGRSVGEWISGAFATGGRDLSAAERRVLEVLAAQPALAELAVIGAAPAVDVLGTRYALPFAEQVTPPTLAIPRFGMIRDVGTARLAGGLLDLAAGRPAPAERAVGEVISTGFALIDHGPTLIDALVGTVMVLEAGDALDGLLRLTGRAAEAGELRRAREQTRLVTDRLEAVGVGGSLEQALQAMPRIVTDPAVVIGLRWELYFNVRSFVPCLNLHTMVFGPGDAFATWLEQARSALVRDEADAAYFEFLGRGFFGTGGCVPLLEGLRAGKHLGQQLLGG